VLAYSRGGSFTNMQNFHTTSRLHA
jgi:hypothetical protein